MGKSRYLAVAGAALVVTAGLLTGCGSSSSSSDPGTPTVTFSLDWTPDTDHVGVFVAQTKDYYQQAGINVKILPYNNSVPDTLISAGKADCGISQQDTTSFSVAAGAHVKTVAAITQHWVSALGYRADDTSITSPKDLDGKTYVGYGAVSEVPMVTQLIKNAGGSGQFKDVVLDTATLNAMYSHKADMFMTYLNWEQLQAKLHGVPMKYFKWTDFGIPDGYSFTIDCNTDWLTANPDLAKRFVQATAQGYTYADHNPDEAGQILIDANPSIYSDKDKNLMDPSLQLMSHGYLLNAQGKFGVMTLKQWQDLGSFYFKAGLLTDADGKKLTTEPDWSTFFTNQYLEN